MTMQAAHSHLQRHSPWPIQWGVVCYMLSILTCRDTLHGPFNGEWSVTCSASALCLAMRSAVLGLSLHGADHSAGYRSTACVDMLPLTACCPHTCTRLHEWVCLWQPHSSEAQEGSPPDAVAGLASRRGRPAGHSCCPGTAAVRAQLLSGQEMHPQHVMRADVNDGPLNVVLQHVVPHIRLLCAAWVPLHGMAAIITFTWHQEASRGMSSIGGGSSADLGCSWLSAWSVRMLRSLQLLVWSYAKALLRLSLLLPGGVLAAPAPVKMHSKGHKQG